MQGIAGEINKMKRDQLQKDARNWISPPDPSKNYNIACEVYQTGTAVWFLQGGVFSEWNAKGTVLWIHGKPGSGKSILLSAIIQHIEGLCAAGLALMAYFYFDFRDTDKQHRRGLLSSLLCQLCAESDPCYEILSRLYSSHAAGTREPSDSALARCLMDMLRLEGQPAIYIIVDALDECPNTSGMPTPREKVLEFLEDLIDSQLPNVHICISSRPEFDIQSRKDILDYVSTVVHSDRRMRKWRAQEKQLVIDALSERADGMFRWVFCQLETLRRSFPGAIRHTLDKLPETLDETYEQILLRIDKEKRNSAYRLFQCLTVAIRPLRIDELAEVLALRFDPGHPAEYRADWRPEDSHEAVLSACSSLVTVVDVDGSAVVQFSHFSVKEFLTSDRLATARPELSRYHILPHLAHMLLVQACLGVLLQLDDSVDKDSIKNLPLAVYCCDILIVRR
ncbi:NACHT domain-containing protein [Lactarius pseudohatsudake]|nr:NACHT domain-containing protein [Lactarius pseudohatsudake]